MILIVDILIFILLGSIVYQDFKDRAISWYLIPVIFVLITIKGVVLIGYQQLIYYTFINIAFVIVQLLCLTLYFSFKNNKLTNIINEQLGIGDILFFLVLTTAFSPVNFIVFFFTANLFTLALHQLYQIVRKVKLTYIPLAGVIALYLIVNIAIFKILYINDFYTNIIADL